jgi:hypothetical protein
VSDLYAVGQPVRLSTVVEDITGAAVDPTTLTLSWQLAGVATITTKTWPTPADLTKDSVGHFHFDLTGLAAGHYRYKWVSTGTPAGVGPNPGPGVLDVADPFADGHHRLVSFADAKAFCRLTGTADDDLLDRMVGWASARIMREVVAVPIVVTETVTARGGMLTLSRVPVRAVTALTGLGAFPVAIQASDLLIVNPLAGLVRANTGPAPCGAYSVTYTAGYDELPPGVDGATLHLVRHWWNQSQAHGSATYGDGGFVPDFDDLPSVVRNMLRTVPKPVLIA